jgi:hypothetical protein
MTKFKINERKITNEDALRFFLARNYDRGAEYYKFLLQFRNAEKLFRSLKINDRMYQPFMNMMNAIQDSLLESFHGNHHIPIGAKEALNFMVGYMTPSTRDGDLYETFVQAERCVAKHNNLKTGVIGALKAILFAIPNIICSAILHLDFLTSISHPLRPFHAPVLLLKKYTWDVFYDGVDMLHSAVVNTGKNGKLNSYRQTMSQELAAIRDMDYPRQGDVEDGDVLLSSQQNSSGRA